VPESNDIDLDNLRERYDALQRRTRALFDANPDMIFRMDREGRYLDYHTPQRGDLAFRPEEFLGQRVDDLFDAEFAAAAHEWIDRALCSNATQYWEYTLRLRGDLRDFEARVVPSGQHEVTAIVRDITDAKRSHERLRVAEARLRRAQLIAEVGTWERDLATDEVWWSDETYDLLELDRDKVRPSYAAFLERVHPDDRPHIVAALQRSIDTGTVYTSHHRLIFPNGTRKVLYSHAHVECDASGHAVRLVGTIQNITDRIDLEREIVSVGERERERISRDLHDGLGQTLTGISLSLKALTNRLEKGEAPPWEILRQLETNVQQAMHETRRATHLLSPRISGFPAALEALARQLEQPGVRWKVESEADHDSHDPEIEAHLYRIAQEATSNAIRHSKAQTIELRYRCDGRLIQLEIIDDGVGFCPNEGAEGLGLRNMRYRAHMVNGILDVQAAPGDGTRVNFSCPCRCPAPLRGLEPGSAGGVTPTAGGSAAQTAGGGAAAAGAGNAAWTPGGGAAAGIDIPAA
jgi:PAS domain S-box-containing protein